MGFVKGIVLRIGRLFKFKRYLSLIELMVVIALIAIISASITYNVRGALDKGRHFRSIEGANRIENVIYMHMAESGESLSQSIHNWKRIMAASPLVKNSEKSIKDGWGFEYKLRRIIKSSHESLEITSEGILRYKERHPDIITTNKLKHDTSGL